jgi:hypothetical protein
MVMWIPAPSPPTAAPHRFRGDACLGAPAVVVRMALASPLTDNTCALSGLNTTPVQNTVCALGRARTVDKSCVRSTCTRTERVMMMHPQ